MSAVDPVAEPSMEEILSSIRDAINDEAPAGSPIPPINDDPFSSGSTAETAFSTPPPGQKFDTATHRSHDPFSELTRKLNETRATVHHQMQQASTPTKPSEAPAQIQPTKPVAAPASVFGAKTEEPVHDERAEFTSIVSNLARRQPLPPPAPSAPSLDAREPARFGAAAPAQPTDPAPSIQVPVQEQSFLSSAAASSAAPSDNAMLDALLRQVVEPAVKTWLNDNLSRIVTEVVREEVRRVASQLK